MNIQFYTPSFVSQNILCQLFVINLICSTSIYLFLENCWHETGKFSTIQVSISSTFLRTNFLYKRCFSSFFYVHVTRKIRRNVIHTKNLHVKCWWNWRQVEFVVFLFSIHYQLCQNFVKFCCNFLIFLMSVYTVSLGITKCDKTDIDTQTDNIIFLQ